MGSQYHGGNFSDTKYEDTVCVYINSINYNCAIKRQRNAAEHGRINRVRIKQVGARAASGERRLIFPAFTRLRTGIIAGIITARVINVRVRGRLAVGEFALRSGTGIRAWKRTVVDSREECTRIVVVVVVVAPVGRRISGSISRPRARARERFVRGVSLRGDASRCFRSFRFASLASSRFSRREKDVGSRGK